MYSASQSPGDLIVAVGDRQVHDAQEFSEEIRRYQPGDAVTFSVLRKGKPMQVAVQLEEEPMDIPEPTARGGSLPASRGVLNGPVGISISVP
jgi:PDZ domain-containing secreted protein